MDNKTPTGLKQLLQSMYPEGTSVIEGIVTGVSPIRITLSNDSIMTLSAGSVIVPEYLTDYSITVDYDSDSDKIMTLHNSLKVNDVVFLLPFNNSKKYFVLGRKG